jgi:hypothetical protein
MPKEYKECVKSYVDKGKSKKEAQKICAISYYKKHGRTPQQDESSLSERELALFEAIELVNREQK